MADQKILIVSEIILRIIYLWIVDSSTSQCHVIHANQVYCFLSSDLSSRMVRVRISVLSTSSYTNLMEWSGWCLLTIFFSLSTTTIHGSSWLHPKSLNWNGKKLKFSAFLLGWCPRQRSEFRFEVEVDFIKPELFVHLPFKLKQNFAFFKIGLIICWFLSSKMTDQTNESDGMHLAIQILSRH